MGAGGGMYPNHPYHDGNYPNNRPYYNQGPYAPHPQPPPPIPPYGYPNYGRGYQTPYAPMYRPNFFPNPIGGRGFFNGARSGPTGGLQSAPPSANLDGNLYVHRNDEHRPHFDEH